MTPRRFPPPWTVIASGGMGRSAPAPKTSRLSSKTPTWPIAEKTTSGQNVRVGIAINEHTDENGAVVFLHACKMGLEGIVSKRLSAPYRSGPSRDWIKVKNPDSPAMRRARAGMW